ncbi:MAG: hypothetical protein OXC63_11100 [Aestuariivita sp.]|nr:hypothetical protein [Aestuariivita sp.]MCY4347729.1 hypothetical protein [Aestuariivita sp.]
MMWHHKVNPKNHLANDQGSASINTGAQAPVRTVLASMILKFVWRAFIDAGINPTGSEFMGLKCECCNSQMSRSCADI